MTAAQPHEPESPARPCVTLRYRLRDEDSWHSREVDLEDFFGGRSRQPEDMFHDVDWVPQHAAVNLLADVEMADLAVTEVTFEEPADEGGSGARLTVKETFWNQGRSRIIEVMQQLEPDAEPYWEVIVDLRRESGAETYELLRLGRENGAVVPIHHAITHARPDGSTRDVTLFPSP